MRNEKGGIVTIFRMLSAYLRKTKRKCDLFYIHL